MPKFSYDTSIGPITIFADESNITGLDFGITQDGFQHRTEETDLIKSAHAQVEEYLDGQRKYFKLPLLYGGTPFQMSVWDQLRKIPYGETRSYGEIAQAIDNPKASRAVGMASNRNPIAIILPCHRVIGADGNLVGFGGGLEIKQKLLDLEQL